MTTEWHFIITAMRVDSTGRSEIVQRDGTFKALPGNTRDDAYRAIVDKVGFGGLPIMFFSLEPNRLSDS